MNLKRLVIWSILAVGVSSVTTQLLTIREFLTQFHGNEITISLVLFCWLLLTGLGSLGAKAFQPSSRSLYALIALVMGLWPLVQMIVIRGLRDTFFIHGAAPGFYPIFFYITLTVAPYCLLGGFILPYALGVLRSQRQRFTSGDLYLTDSIGDIIGGALFSFVLVYWVKPFPTIAFTSAPVLAAALLLFIGFRRYVWLSVSLVAVASFYTLAVNPLFERTTLSDQYGDIRRYIESPYGRVVISREGSQYTFWESGSPLYSGSDLVRGEEKVHYPLSQLNTVEKVLLVSGGLGETLAEMAKHHPAHIDYVELDPYLTRAALDLGVIQKGPAVTIINTDGRRHIRTTHQRYDAIIIDLPDPDTFQINRFFTSEFFALAKGALSKGGIFSFNVSYSPNYISDVEKEKLSTLFNTAKAHFTNVEVVPGEDAYFLCRDGELWLDIPARLRMKSVSTSYIDGFYYGNVTPDRVAQMEHSLDQSEFPNTDFAPRLMNIVFHQWFRKHGIAPTYFFLGLLVFTVGYFIFMRKEEYVLFSTGLATMGMEMLVIFSFQVLYGYVYLEIGAIVTAFLLGLLPGALVGNTVRSKDREKLLLSEVLLLGFLVLYLVWVRHFRTEIPTPLVFLAYCFLFSFMCGFQFPVAAGIIGERNSPAAGLLAADLCGAAVGTIATGTILIPLWGIQSAVIFLILMKTSSIMLTMVVGKRGSRRV